MSHEVTDSLSNASEQIEHAARTINKSRARRDVFDAIYTGKRRVKTVRMIAKTTKLTRMRVLQEGKKLSNNYIVKPTKYDGDTAYAKIDFFHDHKKKILKLARDRSALDAYPTKRKHPANVQVTVKANRRVCRPRSICVDDLACFTEVRKFKAGGLLPRTISERKFKKGIQSILRQKGQFTDWGGEKNDLFTSLVKVGGRRRATAFAFKGPATRGVLTPKKLGKNGDQIQRLFESPAQVFLVQYWGQIDQSVVGLMRTCAFERASNSSEPVYFGIIDGQDSRRIYDAYRRHF